MDALKMVRCLRLVVNATSSSCLSFRSTFFIKSSRTELLQPNHILSHPYSSKASTTWSQKSTTTDESGGVLIYDGPLSSQLRHVKFFSLSTSVLGLVLQPHIVMESMKGEISVGAAIGTLGLIGFFTYVTPLLIHYMAKRYVTAIRFYPDRDSYTATTYSFLLQELRHNFKIEDVVVPDLPGAFTSILIKGPNGKKVPLFITDTAFLDSSHYGRMMGYDKPMDFHLSKVGDEQRVNKHDQSIAKQASKQ